MPTLPYSSTAVWQVQAPSSPSSTRLAAGPMQASYDHSPSNDQGSDYFNNAINWRSHLVRKHFKRAFVQTLRVAAIPFPTKT